jgi:choline dehydrogenase-like flavoprotein
MVDVLKKYDAIVVGAGPGGSTIAALLAKKGKKVLIVDKNPKAGGRMMTIVHDGFHYEMFPINCVPQKNAHYEKTGVNQPSPKSPIHGLYYVGCNAGGSGLGTHQAVDSALNVFEMLSRE